MGFRHGAHRHFEDNIPLSNMFVTMANQMGVEVDAFADSTGDLGAFIWLTVSKRER